MLIVIICIALIVALSVAHALISKYSLVREVLSIFLTGVIVLLVALGIIIWDVQSNGDTHLQDQLVYKTELQCCLDNFEDIPPEYKIQVVDRAIEWNKDTTDLINRFNSPWTSWFVSGKQAEGRGYIDLSKYITHDTKGVEFT